MPELIWTPLPAVPRHTAMRSVARLHHARHLALSGITRWMGPLADGALPEARRQWNTQTQQGWLNWLEQGGFHRLD